MQSVVYKRFRILCCISVLWVTILYLLLIKGRGKFKRWFINLSLGIRKTSFTNMLLHFFKFFAPLMFYE